VVAVAKSSSTRGGDLDRHLHRRLIQTARRTERRPGPTPGLSLTDVNGYRMIGRLMLDQLSKALQWLVGEVRPKPWSRPVRRLPMLP
jgi:hypothetical protein